MSKKHLTFDIDKRGDYAFFIDEKHISGFSISDDVKNAISDYDDICDDWVFFRVLSDEKETDRHGFISISELAIVQWG